MRTIDFDYYLTYLPFTRPDRVEMDSYVSIDEGFLTDEEEDSIVSKFRELLREFSPSKIYISQDDSQITVEFAEDIDEITYQRVVSAALNISNYSYRRDEITMEDLERLREDYDADDSSALTFKDFIGGTYAIELM